MTLGLLAEDLTLALGYLSSSQVRLVASLNPSARAHALSYHHTVDPKNELSLLVWGLSSVSTHAAVDCIDDVLTVWFVVGEVHTITFAVDATLETYKAAFNRFPRATKLVNVKLDLESAPHVARMSSVEVLQCQEWDLTPTTLKLLAPLTNLQRIRLGKEDPSFDMMVQLVDQFQHYDPLCVSTVRHPVITSAAGCDAFVRLAYRRFQHRNLAGSRSGEWSTTITISDLCHVVWITIESKTNILSSTSSTLSVANLLLLLLEQALARVIGTSSATILTSTVHHKDLDHPNRTMELSSEERDLVAIGNVCARFLQDADAEPVMPIFETIHVQAMLMTWLTVATSTPVFDALMVLCWALLF